MVELSNEIQERPATTSRILTPREEVRDALLDATGKLIHRYGYRKTSVEDIAQEAGVSRATAYLYFAGKEALIFGWIERKDRLFLERLRVITHVAESASERLTRVLLARILIRFDEAQAYTQSGTELQSLDELLAALRSPILAYRERQHEVEAELLAEVIRDGVLQGEFSDVDDALTIARLLILGTSSLLPYSLSARLLGERTEVETKARGLVALLLAGIQRPKALSV